MKKSILTPAIALIALNSMAQWSNDPMVNTNVVDPFNNIYEWKFDLNKDNSITTIFTTPQSGKIEMWCNIHDKDGKSILNDGPQLIASEPTMSWTQFGEIAFHDNQDNMLMAYKSFRSSIEQGLGESGVNLDLYKMSATGEMLWDEPLDLNRGNFAENIYYGTTMAQIEDGSYIVAYGEFTNSNMGVIYVERVSADGELLWDEPLTFADTNTSYTYPYLVSAGDNQVLLLYAKGSNQDIMVRKLDFEGSSVWSEDVTVYRGGFGTIPIWTFLSVMPDGEGGMFVSWCDDRFYTNYEKSYVSHILSDGSYGYASGIDGEAVGYTDMHGLRSFEPTMLWDKENKYLYTIRRETSTSQGYQRLMIQKMSESGELLWGSEGVEMRPDNGYALAYFDLQFAEDGNIVAFYMELLNGLDARAAVHKFNAETGEAMWENDIIFTPQEQSRSDLKVTPLIDNEYWIAMWKDHRIVSDSDPSMSSDRVRLYMQRINIDGTLGEPTSVELVENDADIKVEGRSIVAPQGCEVYGLDGVRNNAEDLDPGIYVVRSGDKVQKVIIR